jgi:hypothetical protein
MVYNAQNYWGSGLCPLSGILKTWKLGLFLSSGDDRKTPTLLGLLERPIINHWPRTPVILNDLDGWLPHCNQRECITV